MFLLLFIWIFYIYNKYSAHYSGGRRNGRSFEKHFLCYGRESQGGNKEGRKKRVEREREIGRRESEREEGRERIREAQGEPS